MIKNTLILGSLFLLLGSTMLLKPVYATQLTEYQTAPFCNFTPGGAPTGNVDLTGSCVVYENVNGVANGNLTIEPGATVTLHHDLVWYPGYKITVDPGATIFVNSDSKMVQGKICIKDVDQNGYPTAIAVNTNPSGGEQVTSSVLTQIDSNFVTTSPYACDTANNYYPRETFTTLAYVDTGVGTSGQQFSTGDNIFLSMGFTIDGVTDVNAAAGDIQVANIKNLIMLPGGSGGKIGIGLTNPTSPLHISLGTNASGAIEVDEGTTKATMMGDATGTGVNGIFQAFSSGTENIRIFADPTQNSWINSSKLGIGTTNPGSKLSVNGTFNVSSGSKIYFADPTADANHYIYSSATGGNNMYLGEYLAGGAQGFHFVNTNGGADVMTIAGTGNVGITQTAPNGKLDLASTSASGFDGIVAGQSADNTSFIQSYIDGQWSARATYASGCCNQLNIQRDAGDLYLGNSRGITLGGNITFPTANPSITTTSSYLIIPNGLYISGASIPLYTEARIQARNGISDDADANLDIYGGTSGKTQFTGQVGIAAANTVAYPVVVTSTSSGPMSAVMQINNLDDGGTAYGEALEVNNADNTTFTSAITTNYTGTNGSYSSAITANNSANGSGAFAVIGYAPYGTAGWFQTSSGVAIRADGKVNINLPVGSNALSVTGRSTFGDSTTTGNYGSVLDVNFAGNGTEYGIEMRQINAYTLSAQALSFINASGTLIGSVSVTNTNVGYNTTSDQRLKDNIIDSSTGLDTLMKINVRDFNWKTNPKNKIQGFIAQELNNIYPEAVTVGGEDPTTHPWQVDYGRITPLIVKSVQDQQTEITNLKKQLSDLTSVNAAQNQKLEELQKAVVELQKKIK